MKTSCPLAEDVNETVLSSQAAVTIFIVSILFYSLNFVCPHTCAFTALQFFFRAEHLLENIINLFAILYSRLPVHMDLKALFYIFH